MKYLALFGLTTAVMTVVLLLGAAVSGTPIGSGHFILSVGVGALLTALYWLFKNEPPQDGADQITRLWRG